MLETKTVTNSPIGVILTLAFLAVQVRANTNDGDRLFRYWSHKECPKM